MLWLLTVFNMHMYFLQVALTRGKILRCACAYAQDDKTISPPCLLFQMRQGSEKEVAGVA
jgi:hypothetical protein